MTEAVTAAPTQGAQKGVRIRALGHRFGDNEVLRDIDLDIRPGESVALVGPSGSGKSTLVSLLTGALELQTGSIQYDGETVAKGNRPFAFMPQRDVLMPWRNILDNTAVGLEVAGVPKREARSRANHLFATFGLDGTQRQYPRQLSGGMRQRAAFLRTVVQDQPVLLLDEPFGALDAITRDDLQRWLLDLRQHNNWSMLFITHDIREAIRMADSVCVLPATPRPFVGSVGVDRGIPRIDGFAADPRVGVLEEELRALLERARR